MSRFIILLHDSKSCHFFVPDSALFALDLELKFRSDALSIFSSADTPTLLIPDHGLVIGHLFSRSGRRVCSALDVGSICDSLSTHLLERAWGEYISIEVIEEKTRSLRVLRDPSGSVPCVYAVGHGNGFITSDISIAATLGLCERKIDWDTLAHGLYYPYLRTGRTGLLGVDELLPGCELNLDDGVASVRTAWSPWKFTKQGARHQDPRTAADGVRSAVAMTAKALADTDLQIILELSGGLDSSVVAASLHGSKANIQYCTLVIPSAGVDERQYAALMTESLDGELQILDVEAEQARFEFPTPPSSVLPSIGILQNSVNAVWISAGRRIGVQSFFSGGGGDSVFCYLKNALPAADAFLERGVIAGLRATQDLADLHQCTFWKAGRLTLKKLARRHRSDWRLDRSFLDASMIPVYSARHPWLDCPGDALPGDREKVNDLVATQMFRDATPRGSCAMRLPLLSQPVMEACLKVPTWMWIAEGQNRAVARAAFADTLPEGILRRRSKGTYTSYMSDIYMRNRSRMRQFLEEGSLTSRGLLDWNTLGKFMNSPLTARDLSFVRVFDLCMAENWIRNQEPS